MELRYELAMLVVVYEYEVENPEYLRIISDIRLFLHPVCHFHVKATLSQ